MSERGTKKLSEEEIGKIKNWGERVFAEACSAKKNLHVEYQVPVGNKVIDFRVTNEQVGDRGTLVEITVNTPEKVDKTKQKAAMEESGQPNTVLYVDNMKKVRNALRRG